MSLWPPQREDQAKLDVRSRAQVQKGGQAARRKAAPLGAKGWFRESMCQIAWASRRAVVDEAETGLRPSRDLAETGSGSPAQGVHFADSVAGAPLEPSTVPTAMQKSRLGQETPLRSETWSPAVGIDSSCQLTPSKRSANVPN